MHQTSARSCIGSHQVHCK